MTIIRTVDSPIGPLTLAGDGTTIHRLTMQDQRYAPLYASVSEDKAFGDAVSQLGEYFAGTLTAFDLDLQLEGTPFQQKVWASLRQIPYGETISYRELALDVGSPNAYRAVGTANGHNPVAIVVPCHRVIAADGGLGGYGGGLDRKAFLLELERRVLTSL